MDLDSYISGFVDGEGCFCVSFQPSLRHRLGWEVRPSFSVSQNADRAELLFRIQELWGCGFIRPDRSDSTLKFEVRSVNDLVKRVIPHFSEHPLQSSKQKDVETVRDFQLQQRQIELELAHIAKDAERHTAIFEARVAELKQRKDDNHRRWQGTEPQPPSRASSP